MGVLLYALLCGFLPFDDDNTFKLYKLIQVCYNKFIFNMNVLQSGREHLSITHNLRLASGVCNFWVHQLVFFIGFLCFCNSCLASFKKGKQKLCTCTQLYVLNSCIIFFLKLFTYLHVFQSGIEGVQSTP